MEEKVIFRIYIHYFSMSSASTSSSNIRLGYACVNLTLGISTSQGCIVKTAKEKGVAHLKKLALSNLDNLLKILEWNEEQGIRLYRITSELFPHIYNTEAFASFLVNEELSNYLNGDIRFAQDKLLAIGQYATKYKHRLSFHMQPYTHLASPTPKVQKRSVMDIEFYSMIYDYMNIPIIDRCLILHVGGVYKDKRKTMDRWIDNYKLLSEKTQKMIAIENDEHYYGVNDILYLLIKLPRLAWCFDVFHNLVSNERVELDDDLFSIMFNSWGGNSGMSRIPKFHLSDQDPEKSRGAHAPDIRVIPEYFFRLAKTRKIDIMLECKHKDKVVLKFMKQ